VLFHRDPACIGRFGAHPGVREVALGAPSRLLRDQWAAARLARRERVKLLFNPKYSMPLACEQPTACVCHGQGGYAMPGASRWIDRVNHRWLIPRYARQAERLLCVSESTRAHVQRYLDVPSEGTETMYLGVDEAIRVIQRLPERFFR
jgi:hypothetical protein